MSLSSVFIGGSLSIRELPKEVCQRLDRIIEQRLPVLIGDAPGADAAVQKYLNSKNFDHVRVFCSGRRPRNNIGGWPVESLKLDGQGFAFHSAKDRVMAIRTRYGFMIWDRKSQGTLLNVYRLTGYGKACVVWLQPEQRFLTIRSVERFKEFVSDALPADVWEQALQKERLALYS